MRSFDNPKPGFSADAILLQALFEDRDNVAETPEEKARTLLFSWVLSLRPETNLASAASDLKYQLLSAAPENNPLLPHLCELLDEVYGHASSGRGRRGRRRTDA